ncbi:MAG: hypothetical protein BRD55_07185 [Bacteroidetes bacterium SW_9_63_38]|nr:MAG: hypothetical protein BRD55_07185 [Bacteroidetes bacterium SW_9_63_38]
MDPLVDSHWEELNVDEWTRTRQSLQEQHRNDLLQVFAYANLADVSPVTACLIYPCHPSAWRSLSERGRLVHRVELGAGERTAELVLAAVSMETAPDGAVRALEAAAGTARRR